MALREASSILVFGESGQVAQELRLLGAALETPLEFAGRARCDLLTEDPALLIEALGPRAVINASAYTLVDKAETEAEAAFRLNRDAPAAMARACARQDIPFVHISTDYVFDGAKPSPYVEEDATGPLGVYGRSKLAGEGAVAAAGGPFAIFRTAWVFSPFGANFVKTMLRLGAEREELSVVADQWGRPTFAADIASMCLHAAGGAAHLRGIYHLAGADDAVWADVAEHVFASMESTWGRRPALKRIATAAYPTPAQRPANSRLDTSRLQEAAPFKPRPWRETVDLCLERLGAKAPK